MRPGTASPTKFMSRVGSQLDYFSRELQRQPLAPPLPDSIAASGEALVPLQISPVSSASADALKQSTDGGNLGSLEGVFIPVCLSIWGVLVFLRFPWVVGQAGLLGTLAMFTTGYFMTGTTALSLSAISTNGQVKGGGAYYLISRCLGPEFGGSIGIIFFLGTLLTGAMNLLGFVEPLLSSFGQDTGTMAQILPEGRWWQLLYATIVSLICLALCMVGSSMFARAALFLAIILLISTLSIVGSLAFRAPFYDPISEVTFLGFNFQTLKDNFFPHFSSDLGVQQNFQTVFAIVFPACTGVLAGASMSGDLKNPSKSIPKGTLTALISTYFAYVGLATLLAGSIGRDMLLHDLGIMQNIAIFPPLVAVGVAATSFFSALGSLIGAAKIFQAIGKDDLLPGLSFFKHGNAKDEPVRGFFLTFGMMQLVLVCVEDINQIAPFVTMFSLLTFGVLNLACLLLRASGSPNFRPNFELFNWRTAFAGFSGCMVAMFVVDHLHALYSCLLAAAVFSLIHYYAPPKLWGDVTQSLIYHQSRKYLLRLDLRKEHVKFWRPQVLVLVQDPRKDFLLIKFLNDLKKGGLFILAHIIKGDLQSCLTEYKQQLPAWLRYIDIAKVKAFVQVVVASSERLGAQNLLMSSGLGGMKPNIVVLGFRENNQQRTKPKSPKHEYDMLSDPAKDSIQSDSIDQLEELEQDPLADTLPSAIDFDAVISETDYVGIIEDALALDKAVGIARGFDTLEMLHPELRPGTKEGGESFLAHTMAELKRCIAVVMNGSNTDGSPDHGGPEQRPLLSPSSSVSDFAQSYAATNNGPRSSGAQQQIPVLETRYIDLWPVQMAQAGDPDNFSFDSYTLVLQLGTILHMIDHWRQNYKLRVLIFVEKEEEADEEQTRVQSLLEGLRIKAEIKMVWLRPRFGISDSEDYEKICRQRFMPPLSHQTQSSPSVPTLTTIRTDNLPIRLPRRYSSVMSTRLPNDYVRKIQAALADDGSDEMSEAFQGSTTSPVRSRTPSFPQTCSPTDETFPDQSPETDSDDRPYHGSSTFETLDPSTQHTVLNQLFQKHSSRATTAVILMTLPAPNRGAGADVYASSCYLHDLQVLTQDLPPTFLVHGKGLTVTMSL
ncbi:amino acid permease-domain-containing protein [Phlyctochytrium arcticum]|nr:amino acid permease-domain-containing protein [Phlyctochytrium arcticum]